MYAIHHIAPRIVWVFIDEIIRQILLKTLTISQRTPGNSLNAAFGRHQRLRLPRRTANRLSRAQSSIGKPKKLWKAPGRGQG